MSDQPRLSILCQASNYVWNARNRLKRALKTVEEGAPWWKDCQDIRAVLGKCEEEINRLIRDQRKYDDNLTKIRQAEAFALKAKVAKERLAAAGALKFVRDDESHK